MKMSEILTLGVLEAKKLQNPRWPKYCETPCRRKEKVIRRRVVMMKTTTTRPLSIMLIMFSLIWSLEKSLMLSIIWVDKIRVLPSRHWFLLDWQYTTSYGGWDRVCYAPAEQMTYKEKLNLLVTYLIIYSLWLILADFKIKDLSWTFLSG